MSLHNLGINTKYFENSARFGEYDYFINAIMEKMLILEAKFYIAILYIYLGLGDYIPGEDHYQPYRALYKIAVTCK